MIISHVPLRYAILLPIVALLLSGYSHAASEIQDRAEIATAVQRAFLANDFSALENTSSVYRQDKSRTSSGLWKLTIFYAAFADAVISQSRDREREAAFADLEGRTKRWAEAYPNSPAAHIAHGGMLMAHGWAYRGGGYAATVPPEAWAPFRRYIAAARAYLEAHKSVAAIDPAWYETMLWIARDESWDREQFDALFREAVEREPLFYPSYFAAIQYLLPKWHGDIREIENFAQDAVLRTSAQEGRGMYARIYWYASQSQFKNDIFIDSLANWPQMKDGFSDVVARFPDAWNLNNFARFACLAKDRPKTREILKLVEASFVLEAWNPPTLRDQCVAWALN